MSGLSDLLEIDLLMRARTEGTEVFDQLDGKLKGLHSSVSALASGVGLAALTTGVGALTTVIGEGISAASQYDDAHVQLGRAMQDHAEKWTPMLTSALDTTEQHMRTLGFTDTQVEQGLTALVQAGIPLNEALQAQGSIADLATAKHLDLATATHDVILATHGQGRALQDLGIQLPTHVATTQQLQAAQTALAKAQTEYQHALDNPRPLKDTTELQQKLQIAQEDYNKAVEQHGKDSVEAQRAQVNLENAQRSYNSALDANGKSSSTVTTAQANLAAAQAKVNELTTSQTDQTLRLTDVTNSLSTAIGGAAPAAADTFTGHMQALRAEWDHFEVTIGEKVIPYLDRFGGWVSDHAPEIEGVLTTALTDAGDAANALGTGLSWMWDHKDVLATVLTSIVALKGLDEAVGKYKDLAKAFKDMGDASSLLEKLGQKVLPNLLGTPASTSGTSATGAAAFPAAVTEFQAAVTEFAESVAGRGLGGGGGLPGNLGGAASEAEGVAAEGEQLALPGLEGAASAAVEGGVVAGVADAAPAATGALAGIFGAEALGGPVGWAAAGVTALAAVAFNAGGVRTDIKNIFDSPDVHASMSGWVDQAAQNNRTFLGDTTETQAAVNQVVEENFSGMGDYGDTFYEGVQEQMHAGTISADQAFGEILQHGGGAFDDLKNKALSSAQDMANAWTKQAQSGQISYTQATSNIQSAIGHLHDASIPVNASMWTSFTSDATKAAATGEQTWAATVHQMLNNPDLLTFIHDNPLSQAYKDVTAASADAASQQAQDDQSVIGAHDDAQSQITQSVTTYYQQQVDAGKISADQMAADIKASVAAQMKTWESMNPTYQSAVNYVHSLAGELNTSDQTVIQMGIDAATTQAALAAMTKGATQDIATVQLGVQSGAISSQQGAAEIKALQAGSADVKSDYEAYMGREPSPAEIQYWTSLPIDKSMVEANIQGSAEAQAHLKSISMPATQTYGGGSGGSIHAQAGGYFPAIPGGYMVNLGEGGEDEAVIPMSKLLPTFAPVIDAIVGTMSGGGGSSSDLLNAMQQLVALFSRANQHLGDIATLNAQQLTQGVEGGGVTIVTARALAGARVA